MIPLVLINWRVRFRAVVEVLLSPGKPWIRPLPLAKVANVTDGDSPAQTSVTLSRWQSDVKGGKHESQPVTQSFSITETPHGAAERQGRVRGRHGEAALHPFGVVLLAIRSLMFTRSNQMFPPSLLSSPAGIPSPRLCCRAFSYSTF